MIQHDQEIAASMQNLTLQQILKQTDLTIQKMFLIRNIQDKIKPDLKTFINYCKNQQVFTYKLISSGIKSPMHGNHNTQNKIISYISTDVLTCDHQSLADLFILNLNNQIQSDHQIEINNQIEIDQEIPEEIETQRIDQVTCILTNKYTYLINLFDYINHQTLNQNSLNYLSKALQILIRKKISQFLQFFYQYPQTLKTLINICHYPAISHLLAKLVINDSEILSQIAVQQKKKIISLLIQKIHNQIHLIRTYQIFESIDQILLSSRRDDHQERSLLQKLSDRLVSKQQILFHFNITIESLISKKKSSEIFYSLNNSIAYLTIIINRIIMDQQQQDHHNYQQYKPKLLYQVNQLFLSFSPMLNLYHNIRQFQEVQSFLRSLMLIKFMEMHLLMTKHTRFGFFYRRIHIDNRICSIKLLIDIFTMKTTGGVLLNLISCILEKILIQQEQIAQNNKQLKCVTPSQLLRIIEQKESVINEIANNLSKESTKQRNKDQNGVFYRKFFVILDNYFRSEGFQKQYTEKQHFPKLFSQFSAYNCTKYSQIITLDSHSARMKINQVQQFGFIRKNINATKQQTTIKHEDKNIINTNMGHQPRPHLSKGVILKLTEKIKDIKDKVRNKKINSVSPNVTPQIDQESPNHTPQIQPLIPESPNCTPQIEPLLESPTHTPKIEPLISESPNSPDSKLSQKLSKAAVQGLQFFIRHFNIF